MQSYHGGSANSAGKGTTGRPSQVSMGFGNGQPLAPKPEPITVSSEVKKRFSAVNLKAVKPGSVVSVMFYSFEASPNQNGKGKMIGVMVDDPYLLVEVHNVDNCEHVMDEEVTLPVNNLRTERIKGKNGRMTQHHILQGRVQELYAWESYLAWCFEEGTTEAKKQETGKKASDLIDNLIVGPGGVFIPVTEWDHLTEEGCACCAGPLFLQDAPSINWISRDTGGYSPVCRPCFKNMTS